jgi:hypothetical protein
MKLTSVPTAPNASHTVEMSPGFRGSESDFESYEM